MRKALLAGVATVFLALPAHADANCSQSEINVQGFGPVKGVTSNNCTQQNLDREFDRAAARAAAIQFDTNGQGWSVTGVVAGASTESVAPGLTLSYTHEMGEGSSIKEISIHGGASGDVAGSGQLGVIGATVRF